MKLFLIFAVLSVFVEIKSVHHARRSDEFRRAFANITEFLAKSNHEVIIMADESMSLDVLSSVSGIPHKVY